VLAATSIPNPERKLKQNHRMLCIMQQLHLQVATTEKYAFSNLVLIFWKAK
jgi:hypothetical protein